MKFVVNCHGFIQSNVEGLLIIFERSNWCIFDSVVDWIWTPHSINRGKTYWWNVTLNSYCQQAYYWTVHCTFPFRYRRSNNVPEGFEPEFFFLRLRRPSRRWRRQIRVSKPVRSICNHPEIKVKTFCSLLVVRVIFLLICQHLFCCAFVGEECFKILIIIISALIEHCCTLLFKTFFSESNNI